MKKSNLYIGLGLLAVAGSLTSCKSDYLELPPITYLSEEQLGESIEAARAALYGLCQAMYCGFYSQDDSSRINNGECYFQTFYGDSGSPDFWDSFMWGYQSEFQMWTLMNRNTAFGSRIAWMYGYNLISQANTILNQVDKIPASTEEISFIKAQCLTMRAHGYIRLMQVYGPRWEDRGTDGNVLCLIIRDTPGTQPLPLSTYKECIDFIYNDLNEAISLFESAPGQQRINGYEPDINVARGLFSRIALLNHDWATARDMAAAGRKNFAIMTADEYKQGFADHNREWIWYNNPDPSYIGYVSWGSAYSCNGYYAYSYNFSGAGCISYKLYNQIYDRHNDDVRCELFWTPDKANKYYNFGFTYADFFDSKYVNTEFGYMYGPKSNGQMTAAVALWAKYNNPNPTGFDEYAFNANIDITEDIAKNPLQIASWQKNIKSEGACQPGAQIKFYSYPEDMYATEHPFLRAAELLLTQAEAEYELGNESNARNLLIELNKNRVPSGYTCDLSGEALRDEIRLYRRMELWGEGDCWFSFKRWNTTVTRVAWKEGDPDSDTFLEAYEGTYPPDWGSTNYPQGGGWRYRIPASETNYNSIVAEQLNQ